jgi:pyruvate dehydrogenase E1 component alpha subunit
MKVYDVVSKAVKRAREENEPTLIEARTYRFRGHSMSDPVHGHYRTKDEVEDQKKQDPIELFKDQLLKEKVLTDVTMKEIEQDVKKAVMDSVKFAEESPDPSMDTLFEDIYA